MSYLENCLSQVAVRNKIDLVAEHRFAPQFRGRARRWRFDFADPVHRIGIECEGGAWSRGRHTRGSGFIADAEKYNAATVLGWKVLRYCSLQDIEDRFVLDYKEILNLNKTENEQTT